MKPLYITAALGFMFAVYMLIGLLIISLQLQNI